MKHLIAFPIFESHNWRVEFKSPAWNDDVEVFRSQFREVFPEYSSWDNNVFLAVYDNGDLIGICEFGFHQDHIWIGYIWSKYKQQGLGTFMIKKLQEHYPEPQRLQCQVRKTNLASLGMFTKLGFKKIDEKKEGGIDWFILELNNSIQESLETNQEEKFYTKIDMGEMRHLRYNNIGKEVEIRPNAFKQISDTCNQIWENPTIWNRPYGSDIIQEIFIRYDAKWGEWNLHIEALEDEWFLITHLDKQGREIGWYKCDQISGVLQFLEDLKSN